MVEHDTELKPQPKKKSSAFRAASLKMSTTVTYNSLFDEGGSNKANNTWSENEERMSMANETQHG